MAILGKVSSSSLTIVPSKGPGANFMTLGELYAVFRLGWSRQVRSSSGNGTRGKARVCLKSITSVEDLLRIFSSVEV